jgi:hypothetical protein
MGALVASSLLLSAPAHAANKIISAYQVDQSETRANGHNVFLDDGVHVYTDDSSSLAKAAGYFDVHQALATVGEPTLSWSGSAARPGTQLVVDFNGDGNGDGILVGELANSDVVDGNPVPDWWASNGSEAFVKSGSPSQNGDVDPGGSGSVNHGTLTQWRARFPDAKVIQAGWSLGSGIKGDGTINDIKLGGDTYLFNQGADATTKKLYKTDINDTSLSAGHNEFRPTSGVRTYTDNDGPNSKAAGVFPVGISLASAGEPTIAFRKNSGDIPPGLRIDVDADGDGDFDGQLVKEPAYGNDWWLNTDGGLMETNAPIEGGGSGGPFHGSLAEWRDAFPNAQIVTAGWSLGGGVLGDYIVDSITVGLTKYVPTGANVAPTAPAVDGRVAAGDSITLDLAGADKNGDDLTYTATGSHGTVQISGDQLTFTADDNFHGATSFSYTANDGHGGTADGTVSIYVTRAASTTAFTVSPSAPSNHSNITIHVGVESTGNVHPGKVSVYDGSHKIGSGKMHTNGLLDIALDSKLSAGNHSIRVKFFGTSYTNASDITHTVHVKTA